MRPLTTGWRTVTEGRLRGFGFGTHVGLRGSGIQGLQQGCRSSDPKTVKSPLSSAKAHTEVMTGLLKFAGLQDFRSKEAAAQRFQNLSSNNIPCTGTCQKMLRHSSDI